jgi:hypothetical protein
MNMCCMYPARGWNCNEVVAKIDENINNTPLDEIVCFRV